MEQYCLVACFQASIQLPILYNPSPPSQEWCCPRWTGSSTSTISQEISTQVCPKVIWWRYATVRWRFTLPKCIKSTTKMRLGAIIYGYHIYQNPISKIKKQLFVESIKKCLNDFKKFTCSSLTQTTMWNTRHETDTSKTHDLYHSVLLLESLPLEIACNNSEAKPKQSMFEDILWSTVTNNFKRNLRFLL